MPKTAPADFRTARAHEPRQTDHLASSDRETHVLKDTGPSQALRRAVRRRPGPMWGRAARELVDSRPTII